MVKADRNESRKRKDGIEACLLLNLNAALQEHILHHHELPHGVRLQRLGWWQPGDAIARPLSHEEIAHVSTPAAPAAPATALVEDEPTGSGTKRRKIHVDPIVRDWFLDMMNQWRTERRWSMHHCLAEVRRLCPGCCSTGSIRTPCTAGNAAHQQQHRLARELCSHPQTSHGSASTSCGSPTSCASAR